VNAQLDGTIASAGLCSSKDPKLIQRALDFTRTDVLDQDLYYFYANLSSNIDARHILFEDTLANWGAVSHDT
jgi:hypothetical protein